MNEHLELKMVNGDTVWGGVFSGRGLGRVPKTGKSDNFRPQNTEP